MRRDLAAAIAAVTVPARRRLVRLSPKATSCDSADAETRTSVRVKHSNVSMRADNRKGAA